MPSLSPALKVLYDAQIAVTPHHAASLEKSLSNRSEDDLALLEEIAETVVKLTEDDLEEFCRGYDWICNAFLEEEIYFRRNGAYRLDTFEQAYDQVYSVPEKMTPYMNGLLMTQVWWPNHSRAINYLKNKFLTGCPDDYRLLEIGPGHGMLLCYPAMDPRCGHAEAWDLSMASLDATRKSLDSMGVSQAVKLRDQDLFEADPNKGTFDAIIFSEVLEHLERPAEALACLRRVLNPNGRIYIHFPINSPAPDHLFNLPTPEDAVSFVEGIGFKVTQSEFAPMLGYSLDQARRMKLTISVLVTAQRVD